MTGNGPLPLYTPYNGDMTYTIPDQPSFTDPPPPPPPAVPFRLRSRRQSQLATQNAFQLVTPTQLKEHLALHAFHTLKTSVQDGDGNIVHLLSPQPELQYL